MGLLVRLAEKFLSCPAPRIDARGLGTATSLQRSPFAKCLVEEVFIQFMSAFKVVPIDAHVRLKRCQVVKVCHGLVKGEFISLANRKPFAVPQGGVFEP